MNDLNARSFRHLFKVGSILVIIVTDQKTRPFTKWCGITELLSNPYIVWSTSDTGVYHAS